MAVRFQFIVAPILVAIGAIICIISLATPYWFSKEFGLGTSAHSGLWRECSSIDNVTICVNVPATPWLNATRAMVIISVGLSFLTFALALISIIKENVPFSFAAAVSALAQAGAMVIGLAVFIGKTHEVNHSYTGLSWSFGIGWAGVSFYMTGMIGFIIQAIVLRKAGYAPIN